jgi:high-affinity iron transporter
MLLTSVILVLREVLEAALLFSLLLALSHRLNISFRWIGVSLLAGTLGAAIYGFNIDHVSDWFGGVGQELVNAFLQFLIYGLLCVLAVLAMRHHHGGRGLEKLFTVVMTSTLALAIVREGSEILVFLSGFLQIPDQLTAVLAGSAIGAGIGISVGVVLYFALLNLSRPTARITGAILLLLVAAGMASQAAQLLIQADWLPSQYPLWDSSWLLDEQSIAGQLLYALVSYEATPTGLQVGIHIAAIFLLVAVAVIFGRIRNTGNAPRT